MSNDGYAEKWFDDNIYELINKYQEAHPEKVINNGDPQDYLNMEEVFDWAKENIYDEMPKFTCCICGSHCNGYGNNPYPVVKDETARCCDTCNSEAVIPARLINLK